MNPKAGPAATQATRSRMGTRPATAEFDSVDGLELLTHMATLFSYYRETFLPSPLGTVVVNSMAGRPGRYSKLVGTGDLEHVVERR